MKTFWKFVLGTAGVALMSFVAVVVIVTSDKGAELKNKDGSTPDLTAGSMPSEPCKVLDGADVVDGMRISIRDSQRCMWETTNRQLKVIVNGSNTNVDQLFADNGCPQQTTAGVELCSIGQMIYARSSRGLIFLDVLSGSLSEADKTEVITRFTAALS